MTAGARLPRCAVTAAALALLGAALPAEAHADATASAWTFDAWILAPLAFAALAYAIGYTRWRARASGLDVERRRARWYLAGLVVLVLALVSPLHRAGERSFALHMLEHELLMLVAAPLLVLAHPAGILLWSLPRPLRRGSAALAVAARRLWRVATQPVNATVLQALALWLWHVPRLFDLALAQRGWHIAQHASFVAGALLFWTAMLDRRRAREPGVAIGCLFASALVSGALGALMAFSQSPWYAGYRALGLDGWGLSAVEDQQVAGLLMWIPGGLVHAGVALALLARMLRGEPRDAGARHAH